jgi:GAF domain-containing protein
VIVKVTSSQEAPRLPDPASIQLFTSSFLKVQLTEMSKYHDEGFDPAALSVQVSDMLIATADGSDDLIDSAVTEMLQLLRQRLAMDVVFVSEFVDGRRVFRYVDTQGNKPVIPVGHSDPLEQTWCQRVVDGRMPQFIVDSSKLPNRASLPSAPFPIGTHLSTPIFLNDGQVYGTLCCFSFSPNEQIHERDLKNLQSVATLVAKKISKSRATGKSPNESAPLTLQPKW